VQVLDGIPVPRVAAAKYLSKTFQTGREEKCFSFSSTDQPEILYEMSQLLFLGGGGGGRRERSEFSHKRNVKITEK